MKNKFFKFMSVGICLFEFSAFAYNLEPPQAPKPPQVQLPQAPQITQPLRTVDILNYFEGKWSFESFFMTQWSKTSVRSEERYEKTGMDTIVMTPTWAQDPSQSRKKSRTLRFTGLGGLISIDLGDADGSSQPVTIEGNVYSFKPSRNAVMRMIVLSKNRFIFEHEEKDDQGNVISKQVSAYERVL